METNVSAVVRVVRALRETKPGNGTGMRTVARRIVIYLGSTLSSKKHAIEQTTRAERFIPTVLNGSRCARDDRLAAFYAPSTGRDSPLVAVRR